MKANNETCRAVDDGRTGSAAMTTFRVTIESDDAKSVSYEIEAPDSRAAKAEARRMRRDAEARTASDLYTVEERCDHCGQWEGNVGPWEDGRRFCGGCKAKITLANSKIRAELERNIQAFAIALTKKADYD